MKFIKTIRRDRQRWEPEALGFNIVKAPWSYFHIILNLNLYSLGYGLFKNFCLREIVFGEAKRTFRFYFRIARHKNRCSGVYSYITLRVRLTKAQMIATEEDIDDMRWDRDHQLDDRGHPILDLKMMPLPEPKVIQLI